MKKRTTLAISIVVAMSILTGCSQADTSSEEVFVAGEGIVAGGDASAAVESEAVATTTEENAATHGTSADYEYNESDIVDISLGTTITADSSAVDVEDSTVTITATGTYRLSGTLTDGQVIVDAGDGATVQLILDDADIANADGAAIAVMSAETAIVMLADGSTNTLSDGAVYVFAEGEDEPNATLYSSSDLTITGQGSLVVAANYNDGIASKDGLIIDSGNITVVAADDGIRGKDYVVVNDGTIDITAGGDGIKSDSEEDATMGYISIAAGTVNVTAGGDGIQAATDVLITGGEFAIESGGGSSASLAVDESAKAIKGAASIVIEGGVFDIDSADDAVHSNAAITINAGTLEIATGDDAVHADDTVEINGGTINVTESYEGIEGSVITINAGEINIVASDDGLNVAGGVDGSGTATATGEAGQDTFRDRGTDGGGMAEEVPGDYYIYINGGTIVIDAYGDGIDSNGDVTMTGGTVIIHGSTSSRDSALDHNGTFEMIGGFLIGVNVDGMMSEGINGGTQASIYTTTQSTIAAGSVVHIETSDGDGVLTFEPSNDYSAIVFSSADLVAGESYDVYIGGSGEGEDVAGLYSNDAYTPGTLAGTASAG